MIHSAAVVSPEAVVGKDVSIGPFCVVEANAVLGDRCHLETHVVIKSGSQLGTDNHIFDGAVIGGVPQHLQLGDDLGHVQIGSHNTIRENVTIHRAMEVEHATVIGDHNLIMINAHIAHDCRIGNHVVLINNTMVAGHVTIEDRVYMAGAAGIQQFRRVGRLATVGGQGRVIKDLPPFVTLDGFTNGVVGLNLVGLRRAGYKAQEIKQLKEAYRLIYRSGLPWREILQRLREEFSEGPAAEFHEFLSTGEHGFMPERRTPTAATIKLFREVEDETHVRAKAG